MNKRQRLGLIVCAGLLSTATAAEPIPVGSRLGLFVDDHLIDATTGVSLELHRPTPREVVIVHDRPWEGSGSGYHTVFQDGGLYRMYYKAWQLTPTEGKLVVPHDTLGAYAESRDGVDWVRPKLGLCDFEGSSENNLVWTGPGSHDFTPFKDANPHCRPEARYKAVGRGGDGLWAFQSPDGLRWTPVRDGPVMTGAAFDTQNLAFWDTVRGQYRAYVRDFRDGRRDIRTATSDDFLSWTGLEWLEYPGAPDEQLYTNQILPYYRAPHVFMGFPTRYVDRGWSPSMEKLPNLEHRRLRAAAHPRYGTAVTDGLFMTSRDGRTFHRWPKTFLPPGPQHAENWKYGDNYQCWGLVETASDLPGAPKELSLYATESYWTGASSRLRRYTLRIDGFVSARARLSGGELTTKPLVFDGKTLVINFSTSAAGGICVEIQSARGEPIEGFHLDDCAEIFGDALELAVQWTGGPDVSRLAGTPVRLRFVMKDADLFSFRFR
ncbi:MAG: glycoside hydrolase family protein [Planctomycetota bacterium]|jgi:hypothetical protein